MNRDIEHSHNQFMNSAKHQVDMGLVILSLLFLSNAGAIGMILNFLSNKANENPLSIFWFWGVVFFVTGLGCVFVAYTFSYFQQMSLTIKYRNEYNYQRELEGYNNMLNTYNIMKNDSLVPIEFLKEQYSFLEQQRLALEDRFQKIIKPFSDWKLWCAISFAILSAICLLLGAIFILLGFR